MQPSACTAIVIKSNTVVSLPTIMVIKFLTIVIVTTFFIISLTSVRFVTAGSTWSSILRPRRPLPLHVPSSSVPSLARSLSCAFTVKNSSIPRQNSRWDHRRHRHNIKTKNCWTFPPPAKSSFAKKAASSSRRNMLMTTTLSNSNHDDNNNLRMMEWSESASNNIITGNNGSLQRLCSVSLCACQVLTPLIQVIYQELLSSLSSSSDTTRGLTATTKSTNSVKKVKQDNSAFTIADGLVQRLLVEELFFGGELFRDIVGEEEDEHMIDSDEINGNENNYYQIQGLNVSNHLHHLIDETRHRIRSLAEERLLSFDEMTENAKGDDKIRGNQHPGTFYKQLTIFIDPIDGTREFSTGKGEQCSICIGFADSSGKAVAGVVYRPLSKGGPTWVAGAECEGYKECFFGSFADASGVVDGSSGVDGDNCSLLTTNGSISQFVDTLLEELDMPRVKSGGAGNKMMMLLQSSIQHDKQIAKILASDKKGDDCNSNMGGKLYIQDRGVSRWDTCAAEACLEAFGGRLLKLSTVLEFAGHEPVNVEHATQPGNDCYTYLASKTNLDFTPGTATLTKYNVAVENDGDMEKQSPLGEKVIDVEQVKPYSNLCGLLAFGKEWNTLERRRVLIEALSRAAQRHSPSYD
ncbi:hypothetical protein ACHAXS_008675 [Conticribra weissflogii]